MSDTTTGGAASFEELVRLREAAHVGEFWRVDETHAEVYAGDYGVIAECKSKKGRRVDELFNAEFIAYAANHAVTLLEQERAHSDRLADALAFVLNAPHPPRLPSGACICVQHEDAGKLVDEHAKLRGAE